MAQAMTSETLKISTGQPVELPNGDFVANAQMTREGVDLHLLSPDGHEIVVEGYFAQSTPPDLVTADGSRLSPQLIAAFVPPEHTGQYAAAGTTANDASPAGKIAEVTGEAHIVRADGTRILAAAGTPIFEGDVIETSKTGAVNLQFADNTTFAISENARMSVDKFIYDSAHQSGSSFFSMLQGVFVYTSGLIGKTDPGSVNIDTPVGSIGIRGTVVAGQIAPSGHESKITILDGAITLTNGSGTHEMHDSFNTVSLSSYQSQPMDLGQMDAATFSQSFHSVAGVAGDTISHFGGTAAGAPQNNTNDNAAQPAGDTTPSAPAQDAAPPAPAGDSGASNAPAGAPPAAAMAVPAPVGDNAAIAGNMVAGYGAMGGMAAGFAAMGGAMTGNTAGFNGGMNFGTAPPAGTAPTAGTYYGGVPANAPPAGFNITAPTGSNTAIAQAAGAFHIGFANDPKYADITHYPGGPGLMEFMTPGVIGKIVPFNAAGPISFAISVAGSPQHINPEFVASTDTSLSLDLGSASAVLTTFGITAGDEFTLQASSVNSGTPVLFTIGGGETVQDLIDDINGAGFDAELINNKLEISLLDDTFVVAEYTNTPAFTLFGGGNVNTISPVHEYFLTPATAVFSINAAGEISVNDPLALSHFVNPAGFNLVITATDSLGHTSTMTQHLDIRDLLPGADPLISDAASITGSGSADFLVGMGAANMGLFGNGGADVLIGSAGNNDLGVNNAFKWADGGGGTDKLSLSTGGTHFTLDFTNSSTGQVRNIEEISLGSSSDDGNQVKLRVQDVFSMTDTSHTLHILQDASSMLHNKVTLVNTGTGDFQLVSGALDGASNATYTGMYNGSTVTLVVHNAQTTDVTLSGGHIQVAAV